MTKLHELMEHGQSIWLDYVRRSLITSGELEDLIGQGVRGITSNPSIFEAAIVGSADYDEVLQSLGEEKEYRIMEILLSSVSAYQLLTGKILALGAAGLVQMFFWLLSARLLVAVMSTNIAGFLSNLQIPIDLAILSMIYFILGYLLFAILMAVVGSIAPTAREGQQLSVLFTMTAVLPFMFAPLIIENANHIVVQILTVFPLTAPLSVMIRLGVADIPSWQLVLSIILLILSVIGGLILGAKVFRTFLLMYGKRPALNEIIRSLRQA